MPGVNRSVAFDELRKTQRHIAYRRSASAAIFRKSAGSETLREQERTSTEAISQQI
jgi:hypothetical protein